MMVHIANTFLQAFKLKHSHGQDFTRVENDPLNSLMRIYRECSLRGEKQLIKINDGVEQNSGN